MQTSLEASSLRMLPAIAITCPSLFNVTKPRLSDLIPHKCHFRVVQNLFSSASLQARTEVVGPLRDGLLSSVASYPQVSC